MGLLQEVVLKLLGKRKAEEVEDKRELEEGSRRKRAKVDNSVVSVIMSSMRKGYTSVVSWLFPQLAETPPSKETKDADIDDGDEVQVVKIVKGKRGKAKNSCSKGIQYDILSSFPGFSKPSKEKDNAEIEAVEETNSKTKQIKSLKPKSNLKLSKVIQAREAYRKMLEQVFSSNFRSSSNQIGHFEEYLKEHTVKKKKSKISTNDVPDHEVVSLDDNSKEDINVLEEDEIEILNNLSELKTEIELVQLDDSDPEIVDVTDESDYESDEDEKYYENRTFIRKECDISFDPTEEESENNSKGVENAPEIIEINPTANKKGTPATKPSPTEEESDKNTKVVENAPEAIEFKETIKKKAPRATKPSEKIHGLSESMLNSVRKAQQSRGQVLVDAHRIKIRGEDILTLNGLNWLNDEVINFYFSMIASNTEHSVYAFTTFFYPRLESGGHGAVARWTKSVDIFSYSLLLVPIHLGLHWALATVNLSNMAISYYDSMNGNNSSCLTNLNAYLHQEYTLRKGESLDPKVHFDQHLVKSAPQQMNGSDCGVFTCQYARYLSRSAALSFKQSDMPLIRKRMAVEILTNSFLPL